MKAVARGNITFQEAQKGEDTYYIRISPSTLTMSNELTADDIENERDWWWKYHSTIRLMRGDQNCSGYITSVTIYKSDFSDIHYTDVHYTEEEIAEAQEGDDAYGKTTDDVKIPADDIFIVPIARTNVINPVTGESDPRWRLDFTKFDTILPCNVMFQVFVTARIPIESGANEYKDFSDYVTLMCSVSDYYSTQDIIVRNLSQGNVVTNIAYTTNALGQGELLVTKGTVSTSLADLSGADDLRDIETLTGTGILKRIGNNRWQLDQSQYITENQNITLSGDVSGSGSTSIVTTIGAGKVTNSMLAGSIENSKLLDPSFRLGGKKISLGDTVTLTQIGVPEWSQDMTVLRSSLDIVYHPKGGANNVSLTASTLSAASSLTVGNNNIVNAKIYFGSLNNWLGVVNVGTSLAPSYAIRSTLPIYSDSWISALGQGSGSGGSSGGGGVEHIVLSESEFEALGVIDDGVIYMVYEDVEE